MLFSLQVIASVPEDTYIKYFTCDYSKGLTDNNEMKAIVYLYYNKKGDVLRQVLIPIQYIKKLYYENDSLIIEIEE